MFLFHLDQLFYFYFCLHIVTLIFCSIYNVLKPIAPGTYKDKPQPIVELDRRMDSNNDECVIYFICNQHDIL